MSRRGVLDLIHARSTFLNRISRPVILRLPRTPCDLHQVFTGFLSNFIIRSDLISIRSKIVANPYICKQTINQVADQEKILLFRPKNNDGEELINLIYLSLYFAWTQVVQVSSRRKRSSCIHELNRGHRVKPSAESDQRLI